MPRTQVPEEGQRVQNINELKDLKPRPEAVIRTEGAASRNDGLSNLYWWDPNGVATNANGTTIISSNVSGYTSGDPDEGVWRRMFKPSSEIESQIEKSAGNQGAVQYSDGSGGFLGDASYLYVDDSNGTVGIGTSSPNTSVALEIAGTTEISNNTIQGNGGNLNLVEPYLNAFGGGRYGFNSNGDPVISDASNDTRYVANDNGATVLTNGNVQVVDSLSVGQTSSPGFTLDVNGDANISSNLDVGGDATISGALNVQDFTFDQSSGDLVLSDNSGVELIRQPKGGPTQFVQGAEIGSIETPEDSLTQVINASSTSAASSGDVVGYTFAVDNQSVLEVKADADGSGGITNKRVNFSSGVDFSGAGDGLVSNNGNLDVRLPISDGATPVANVYAFNFGTDINVRDDGGNQVTVEHANTGAADSSNTLPTVIRSVSTDGRGHVTSLSTGTFNDGTDINISGNTINHANTGSDQSTGNSGGTFIQNVSTDGRGHVGSVSSNSFSAGDGLNLSGTTFNARIAVQEGGTGVGSGAYLFNFGNQLNVNDDGSNQVSVSVNDGGGSGLDADTLDGIEGSNYARTDIAETFNDEVYFTGGNVGIGTSSPSSLLDIQDFIHLGTGLDAQDAAGNILLGDYFGQATFKIAGAGGPSTDYFYMSPETANQFEIQSGGNLVVRAEDNQNFLVGGNVGIGTTSPNAKLDISNGDVYLDNNQEIKWGGGGNSPRIIDDPGFIGTGDDFIIDGVSDGSNGRQVGFRSDRGFYFLDENNNQLVNIDSGGNVGIGTNSPNQPLDVEGAADLNGRLNMRGNDVINVNTLNLSNVTSNNGSSHIDWTQPVHFNNDSGNNENYVARFSKNGASKPAILTEDIQIDDFTFDQDSGDLVLSDNNGVELIRQPKAGPTQFIQGAEIGSIEAPTDSFTQVINAPSTSAAASGDLVGYTFAVDNQSILEVKADADGSGGITNKRVDFPSDVEFGGAGDGLVSSGGNLNVRLPITDGGSPVANVFQFNIGGALEALDDGGNQTTIRHFDTSSQGNVSTGGATVIDDINLDDYGHITNINTENRSLDDWAAANANLNLDGNGLNNVRFINLNTGEGMRIFGGDISGTNGNDDRIFRIEDSNSPNSPDGALVFTSGDDDKKLQEWHDGGVVMHQDLNMNGNAISSVGNVDGVDISAHASNDDAHHPDHRDGISHITFNNREGGDFTSDGDLLFDRSEGLFIYQNVQPGNVHGGSDAYLVLSAANISEGDGINISGGKGQDSGPVRFDARLPVNDGATSVTNAYEFVFGNQLNVNDDGSNQVTVAVDESGLDADSVDGYEGDEIAIRAEDEIITGQWSFPNGGTIAKGAISWDGSGRIDYRYGKSEYPTAPRANGALQDRVVFNGGTVHYAAYEPGTEIYIRDSSGNTRDAIGTSTSATRGSFSASSGEVIRTNKPVELLDSNRRPLPAVTMTGMQFYTGVSRNSPENLKFYAPKEDAEVTIELGSDGSTQSLQVPADRSTHEVSISHGGSEDFYVTSTSPVLFVSEGSGGDRKIIYPMAYEIMGDQLNDVQTINGNSPQESQTNYYRNDDEKLSGWGTADGSGGDAETTIPVDMLGNRYIYGNASDYQITTIFPTVVEVYDEFGNQVQSHDLTGASRKNPQTASVGSDSGDATDNIGNGPLLFKSEAPFLIRGNATNNDEYTFYGWRDDLREKSNSQVWGDSIVEGSIDPENVSDKFAIVDENETITGTWTYDSNGQQLEFDHDGNRRLIDINRNGTGEWSLSASGPDIHFDDVNGGPEDVLYLESGGNVGIQTDSPSSALDVNGDIYVNKTIARSSDSSQERLTFDTDGTLEMDRQLDFELNTDGSRSAGSVRWAFIAAGNEKMRIEESGNVGIGTSSPEVTGLHIEKGQAGSDPGLLRIQSSSAGSTEKGDTYAGIELGVDGGNTGASGEQAVTAYIKAKDDRGGLTSYEDGGLSFGTMDAGESYPQEQMFIDAAGKVGIGTNSPSYDLEVSGTSSMNRLNLKNEESANSDGDIIRDNSVGFIGKWGGNTQAVFWDSNNVSTGSNLTVNGGLGQESQPNISIVNNPQFSGGQIGLGNDSDVINYEDSNNASGPYWNNKDKLEIRGDGSVSGIELEAGYMHATQAAHVSGPIKVDDEVNFSGNFNVEYNSNSESLDFIYTG